jgi:ABC-2 type transport system permease protein
MRTLKFLLQKEFRQLLRNKGTIRMLIIAPVIQLLLLPMAADYSVKNISIAIVDHDHSQYSQEMISKINSSGYFQLTGYSASFKEAYNLVEKDKADIVLEIPEGFEKNIIRENAQKIFVAANAINGTKAGLGGAYLASIITEFNSQLRTEWIQPERFSPAPTVTVSASNWYNPFMDFHLFIVPGILVTLLTGIGIIQAALGLVKEKEIGTIEQINVTPIKKYQFILGKLIPYVVMGFVVLSVGLLVSWLFYGIIPVGSFALLYGSALVYLFSLLGMGLLISTYCNTQQEAMSISLFFLMIFNLMSGLFTSLDSMPEWAKFLAHLFPVSHFIEAMRMIVLKGSTFSDVAGHLGALVLIGVVFNVWAIINYRKTT